MASKNIVKVKLASTESPYFYTTTVNKKTRKEKLVFKKYDPRVRKHVEFKEEKIGK